MISLMGLKEKFPENKSRLLISCPKDPKKDGGLFVLDFDLNNISRIFTGDCRGIAPNKDGFFVGTNSHGVLQLDKELNIMKQHNVPQLDIHGLRMDEDGLLYIVETKHNSIGIYQTNPFKRIDELKISNSETDEHHINDIWIEDGKIYVSMFSFKGGWKQIDGNYDGVIARYNLEDKEMEGILLNDLQLPHSVMKINNELFVCESLNMNLMRENKIVAQFNGFTRGLAYDSLHLYIGQSEMRHLNRILSKNTNVSQDCGIYVFNIETKTNRFIHIPANQIYEIYNLSQETKQYPSSINLGDPGADTFLLFNEWHEHEQTHRWTKTNQTTIILETDNMVNTLIIDAFSGYPYELNLSLFFNGKQILITTFKGNESKYFEIPLDNFKGKAEITLKTNLLWSPSESLGTNDDRFLGIAIRKIAFS
ncbi:DUF4915 domain-containing protein [Paenibacillus filicis]|uniref:DUF4915 domain-containing protein n=1 Tax=Paenibacillus gyeongsangnamensis TaxID=3388067 RepID=A0ABT4Q6V5_9BACL|nr:DUF4915 domain-containing protein [Paenibacillus filicis]MCZ8512564.1 DUF4915 domain-containing protein [Paenibacillus filicis]